MKTQTKKDDRIPLKNEARSSDAILQARIDAQAYELIAERKRILGDRWRENCPVRIPAHFVDTE